MFRLHPSFSAFRIALPSAIFFSIVALNTAYAQDYSSFLDEETEKTLELIEEDFDQAIKDFGELSGEVFVCLSDENASAQHEERVDAVYSEVLRLFGYERGFSYAAHFGYGAASELSEELCEELTDEFEDQYGAIAEKYDLID